MMHGNPQISSKSHFSCTHIIIGAKVCSLDKYTWCSSFQQPCSSVNELLWTEKNTCYTLKKVTLKRPPFRMIENYQLYWFDVQWIVTEWSVKNLSVHHLICSPMFTQEGCLVTLKFHPKVFFLHSHHPWCQGVLPWWIRKPNTPDDALYSSWIFTTLTTENKVQVTLNFAHETKKIVSYCSYKLMTVKKYELRLNYEGKVFIKLHFWVPVNAYCL